MTTVEVDRQDLARLVFALRAEADGRELRRDLVRNLRVVAQPALAAVRVAILTMPSKELGQAPSLRARIAAGTGIQVRLTGRRAGVSIRVKKAGMPRNFRNAPRHLNSAKPWRHPVFGSDNWVNQISRRPGWFDTTLDPYRPLVNRAAAEAMDAMARRISAKTRR